MYIKHDPIEKTKKYKDVMKEIQPILDKEFPSIYRGACHAIWKRKTELLKQRGIDWKSPSIMNPNILFD